MESQYRIQNIFWGGHLESNYEKFAKKRFLKFFWGFKLALLFMYSVKKLNNCIHDNPSILKWRQTNLL